jgi:hypothetical protein
MVSWDDAQLFLARLNERDSQAGWKYRLPTEAEWEYACRGGALADRLESAFDFYLEKPATTLTPDQANFDNVLKRTCKVGSYKPNRLGLYDMHGNVWEWCDDAATTPQGTPGRVRRGGGWMHEAASCRAVFRGGAYPPTAQNLNHGLRVARVRIAAVSDRFQIGSAWKGKRTYQKGMFSPATVTYELYVRERDGLEFKGHVFDNGPGRNFAKVEGEIKGDTLHWREYPGHMPFAVMSMEGKLQGDTMQVRFKGDYGPGRPANEGVGELKLDRPNEPPPAPGTK